MHTPGDTRPRLASSLGSPVLELGLLGSLYFSQGLPLGFFTQALPVMLREDEFTLGEIGLTSMLAMPWGLKFLWAPFVDSTPLSRLGRRKSWIVPLQLGSALLLLGLAMSSLVLHSMPVLMAGVFLLNLIAATQDIATDGLALDVLAPSERGLANGLQVAGYRVGMVVGGGALLILHDELGSSGTFVAMAALTALATLPILLTRESERHHDREPVPAAKAPHFLRRPGTGRVLLVVVTYKAGEAFATGMLRPYFSDLGLTLGDIGWLLGTVGFVSGLVGALLGGALANRLGRQRALVVFGLLQAATVAGYAFMAASAPGLTTIYALCAAEHLAGGMATVALFTCMMDWCSVEQAASDYTVQASAVVIATGMATLLAGVSAQALGYANHFALASVLSLSAVAAVMVGFPRANARASGGPLAAHA